MKFYLVIFTFLLLIDAQAWWREYVDPIVSETKKSRSSLESMQDEALKVALKQGVEYAVTSLGKKNGYFDDKKAKIILPESVRNMEPYIRKGGGDEMLDNLILSMNSAATQAAPKTVDIFYESIKSMTISDAQKILKSEENALSEYFKTSSYADLKLMVKPIVKKMMDENRVSHYYKEVRDLYEKNSSSIPYTDSFLSLGKSFGIDKYVPPKDLDAYVTKKAIDGLFVKISQEEKKIRDKPLVQKSKLIRDVFGSI